ncbi:hypothetical protein HZZ13_13785 [Bradyrhizobium sp. CNPSo 4010]|uniref:Uncharacterized protein n=1 Tax=Bradyrhizobium agreste TaxID=2751811 RepID=A0ABS0PPS6_9BRAD|nr:hypothetical protein [Bradyrhizobium agreste]MBH5398854.1 hypothetical protein [Bradyrhizobium agreste]
MSDHRRKCERGLEVTVRTGIGAGRDSDTIAAAQQDDGLRNGSAHRA